MHLPSLTHVQSSLQSTERQIQDHYYYTRLIKTTYLCKSITPSTKKDILWSQFTSREIYTDFGKTLPERVAAVRKSFTKKGVYEREIRRTANAVRESNRAVHDSKLTIYVDWCESEQIYLVIVSSHIIVSVILNYLVVQSLVNLCNWKARI